MTLSPLEGNTSVVVAFVMPRQRRESVWWHVLHRLTPPPPSQPNNLRYSGDGLCECYVEERLVMAWLLAILGGGGEWSIPYVCMSSISWPFSIFHQPAGSGNRRETIAP